MREELLNTEIPPSASDPASPSAPALPSLPAPPPTPGALIGRYVVLSKIGAGAMGLVLAAYDPKLDRKVALKLMKPRVGSEQLLAARLQREAQALAKLDHPNVVAVHDVGEHGDQLFVGMEYVEGQTLGQWSRAGEGPRPWPEVLRVFRAAGQGLAAAHEAGLIHRDFKPDNVMVGDDGRVRVMDFGLVRSEHDEHDEHSPGDGAPFDLRAGVDLTQTGAMMGTPAYMSLEQFGGEVDARSDQFSFCVALYEALYGERPFGNGSLGELVQAIEDGQIRDPPRDTKVPSWLRKVVVRGLAADKHERWPSLTALLDALADNPALRRDRRRGIVLAGLLGLGVALGAWYAVERDARTCSAMDAPLEGIWDAARRRELERAIIGTQLSYAPGTWERVEAKLDLYTEAWVASRAAACEATHRGEQSGELLDRRMACLDERLPYLRSTVDVLAVADTDIVINAVQIVDGLPEIEPCASAEGLRDRLLLPEDPERARRVKELDARVAELEALTLASKYELAQRELERVLAEAETLAHEPLLVRIWLRSGELEFEMGNYEAAEATLSRTYWAALGLRMTEEASTASWSLIHIVGYALARPDEGRRWARDAQALARAADSDIARGGILNNLGAVDVREEKFEDALDHFTRAHAFRVEALGDEHPMSLSSLGNMGIAAAEVGDYAQARAHFERALELRKKVQGGEHPSVATSLHNLSTLAIRTGDYEDARVWLEQAHAIRVRALGPEHPGVASSLEALGNLARERARPREAREYFERALAIREQALGADHPDVGNLRETLEELGRDEAESL